VSGRSKHLDREVGLDRLSFDQRSLIDRAREVRGQANGLGNDLHPLYLLQGDSQVAVHSSDLLPGAEPNVEIVGAHRQPAHVCLRVQCSH
jgi:hypothetical protein